MSKIEHVLAITSTFSYVVKSEVKVIVSTYHLCIHALALVTPMCVPPITLSCMVGFEINLAQISIMTRRFVANKNHVARSEVKVTVNFLHGLQ